jgi:patatin-like phospholipase/acyl hydrolase
MATYRIFSFDGGGIRGLVATVIVERLMAALPDLLSQTDLLAGTSTGGVMALALARGIPPAALTELYYSKGPKIFDDSFFDNLLDLGQTIGAQYDNRNLRQEMQRIFGDTRLQDLPKKVLVPSFDLDNEDPDPDRRSWKAKFFHNFSGNDTDGAVRAYKVAIYTSSAPTYFPSFDGYIDGGVVTNNPSVAAIAQTQDRRAEIDNRPTLEEIKLLSIGTGQALHYIKGQRNDWGYAQWAKPIITLMMDGSMGVIDYQCRQILGENYRRISPILPDPIDLNDWRKRDELVGFAQTVKLDGIITWLGEHWGTA